MLIGVTGNIGSGKSTFCTFLKLEGYEVINGDELAKSFLEKEEVKKEIVSVFGKEILNAEGKIDKRKLGKIVFNDKKELEKLTKITHPLIVEKLKRLKQEKRIVFFEAAVIVEYNWQGLFDKIVTVYAYRGQRLLRAARKFGLKNAVMRDKLQLPYSIKFKYTDYLICNTKSLLNLKEQCKKFLNEIEE